MRIYDLLFGDVPRSRLVARCGPRSIALDQFRADVAANAAALRLSNCRRGLLITQDTYWSAVGILALHQAGATVVMPPNALPVTLASLAGGWDCLVSDTVFPSAAQRVLLHAGNGTERLQVLDPRASMIELFTSGSSGDAKRVVKTLGQMETEAAAIETLLKSYLPESCVVTGTVSHQHLYGLSYRLFWPLCSGRVVDGTIHQFWESLWDSRLSGAAIVSSPAHLTRIPPRPAMTPDESPGFILSAGAPLSIASAIRARDMFAAPVLEIYGSTETGTIAWRNRDELDEPWRPAPGVSVRQAPDRRILVTSTFLEVGAEHEGADRIQLLSDGRFALLDRADRIVKLEGKRISLPEVEKRLLDLPSVAAAFAVVLPGDPPCLAATVVLSPEGTGALADDGAFRFGRRLRKELSAVLEPAGIPRRWRFVAALPSGPLGKVKVDDVMALFDDQQKAVSCDKPVEPDLHAVRRGSGWVELDLFNRPDLLQLDGHFPGMAIVPGVAQVDWAVKMAARFLNLPAQVATSFQVKFHRLTLPRTNVTLRLDHDSVRQRLRFEYRKPDQQLLTSGAVRLEAS